MSQIVQIPFRAGIDEGTDPKQLPPGTLKVGKNVRQDKLGRIVKRWGLEELPSDDTEGGTAFSPTRLMPVGRALSASDGTDVRPFVNGLTWKRADRLPALASTYRTMTDTTRTVTQATVAVMSGTLVEAFSTGLQGYGGPTNGAIYVQLRDAETGQIVLPPTLVNADASAPKVFAGTGSVAYITYRTSAGDLKRQTVNLSFHTIGTEQTIDSSVDVYDGFMVSGVCFMVICKATGLHIKRVDLSTPTVLTTVNPAGAATYVCCAIHADASTVRVVYSTTAPSTSMITRAASTLGAMAGPTQINPVESTAVAVHGVSNSRMYVVYSTIDGSYFHATTTAFTFDEATLVVDASFGAELSHHISIASRIFEIDGRYFFAAYVAVIPPAVATSNDTDVSPQSTVIVEANADVDVSAGTPPHRRMATLESRTSFATLYHVTQAAIDDEGRIHLAATRKQREPVGTEAVPLAAIVHRIEAQGEDWGRIVQVGESAIGVASAPFSYDGASAFPYGFIHEPDILTTSKGAVGTGSMGTGDYLYCCFFEWRDARGILHRSAPSATVRVTGVNATGSVTLRIAQTSIDAKQSVDTGFGTDMASPVRIVVCRSVAGGSILYRLTHEPSYNVMTNDPTNASVTFTDTRADSSITGTTPTMRLDSRPQLYTDSELAEVNPGAATTGTLHRNRVWLISGDRRTVQFSKKIDEDVTIAPGFNEEFVLPFTNDKYWLASLDDKLIAGGDYLDAVYGDGPASDGSGIDWQVQRIHSDASCTNPRSVAVIPPGLVFQSPRGFELLDRGLNVTYIGGPVEDTLADYPNVTSAVLVPEEQEVRFTCINDAGTRGVVVVLNYQYRAWYVRTYYRVAGGAGAFEQAFVDGAYIDGVYTVLTETGIVWQESSSVNYDTPIAGSVAYVSMRAEVPVYPVGPAGWHRLRKVQVVGESADHHKLHIEVARDFAETAEQTKTFEDGGSVTDIGPLEAAEMVLRHQKRQAAVVTIYDSEPDTETYTTGAGPILEMLALYIEPKEGLAKVPAGKRA